MFKKLIDALLGAFGVTRKHLQFKPTDKKWFVNQAREGDIFLTRSIRPGFLQGGIQGTTKSAWQHAGYIRKVNDGSIISIEAIAEGVCSCLFNRNLNENTQIELWHNNELCQSAIETLHTRADAMLGTPYDVAEIIHHVFPFIGHSKKLRVCSSLCTHIYKPIERIVKRWINPAIASPRDLRDYFVREKHWTRTNYNC